MADEMNIKAPNGPAELTDEDLDAAPAACKRAAKQQESAAKALVAKGSASTQ